MTATLTKHERNVYLGRLANFLDDLPHDKFYMPEWECGAAVCACGWGKRIHGDKIGLARSGISEFAFAYGISVDLAHSITAGFREYFELYGVTAEHITPRMAADRIRKVLAIVNPAALAEANTDRQESASRLTTGDMAPRTA